MNVSPNFSPPITLMKPYFTLSGFFYLLSMSSLYFLEPTLDLQDFRLLAWVHLYMLGFVMLAIFAAMAQLGPIVIESAHYSVNIFKYLWIFLLLGLIAMLYGFLGDVTFLLIGGVFILLAMLIYSIEFLLTLKNSNRKTSITKAMGMSTFFLLIGILTGLSMALAFNGYLEINPQKLLQMHTFGLVVGFVILLFMGISLILIPMFGSSARISEDKFAQSFYTLTLGIFLMMLSTFFETPLLKQSAYFFTSAAILLYFYQLYSMARSRKRSTHDIWAKHMYLAFSSFALAFLLLILYLFTQDETLLRTGLWLLFVGCFAFLIIGNLYKIIPFLIWFHIYSPLIETQSVPMLHELLPQRLSALEFFFSFCGVLLSTSGLLLADTTLFTGGLVLLNSAALLFFLTIISIFQQNRVFL